MTLMLHTITSPLLTNVSALPGETRTLKIVYFQSSCIPCLEDDTALACYIVDTHQLSSCSPRSPPAWRRTAHCSPVLRQQRTLSATRRTLADNAAGVQERCRATSHCSARRRDRSASWLETLVNTFSSEKKTKSTACSGNFWSSSHFRNTVCSMTEKTHFPTFVFPYRDIN